MKDIKKDIIKLNNKFKDFSDRNKLVSLYDEELTNILDKHELENKGDINKYC